MKLRYNAPVMLTLVLAAAVALVIDSMTGGTFIATFLAAPAQFNPLAPLDYVRIVGHVVGHANWSHLFGNAMLLLLLGPMLEEKYGSGLFLAMIAATAAATGLLNALLFDTGLIGASGIVFMCIVLGSLTNVRSGEIPLTFILVALLYCSQEIMGALRHDGISQFAHLFGGACGALFGFVFAGRTRSATPTNAPSPPTSLTE